MKRSGAGAVAVLVLAWGLCSSPLQGAGGVEGYVATLEVSALAPAGRQASTSPEAQALLGTLKTGRQVTLRAQLAKTFSRVEVLSEGFILPPGTLILHEASARHYVLANPREKTFVIMDAETLVSALEGSLGVVNSEYQARARHTHEAKAVAGIACRKALLEVTYASSIPFESDRILVAQKNEIEIWHAPSAIPTAALEHFLFKFRQDQMGQVRKVIASDIGFPMEIRFVVTPAKADAKSEPQAGSFAMRVTEIAIDRHLDPELFQLPPAGYRKLERNPYFAGAAAGSGAAQ